MEIARLGSGKKGDNGHRMGKKRVEPRKPGEFQQLEEAREKTCSQPSEETQVCQQLHLMCRTLQRYKDKFCSDKSLN